MDQAYAKNDAMRVAIIASSYNYIRDGVALTLNRLVAYLERAGVEVLVFAPVGAEPAIAHAGTLVPVPSIAIPGRKEYRCAFPLPKRVKLRLADFKPDIIHIALAPDPLGYSALKTAQAMGVPVVASYHTRYETYLKHYHATWLEGLLKSYLRYAYGQMRQVYVPSRSTMDALRADGFAENFKLWPRGVDTELFRPANRLSDFREKHSIGAEDFVVSFVSRLVREKQTDTLIATFRELERRGIAHKALIVGDGPERAQLERELPQAIFTGALRGRDLAESYAASDVFVFPSETETFGNVTLEAMASGLPCVCADATGSASLVVNGETGFLVTPRDVGAFAAAIGELSQNPDLRRQMGAAGRSRSLQYSWDDCMARILGYYQETLRAEPSGAVS